MTGEVLWPAADAEDMQAELVARAQARYPGFEYWAQARLAEQEMPVAA
jgi:hypothetical protein